MGGKWGDKIRDGINEFLNGGELNNKVEQMFDEELTSALEEFRPEIKTVCHSIVKQVIDTIKNKEISIDKSKLESIYSKLLVETFDYYESDLMDILGETLKTEFKYISIIPTKK